MLEKFSSLFPGSLGNQPGEVRDTYLENPEKYLAKKPCPSLEEMGKIKSISSIEICLPLLGANKK
jgi:hypothetical protein